MKKELFAVVSLMSLFGCATANVTRLSKNVYPPKPDNCDITVLGDPPTDKKYEELGIVIGGSGGINLNTVLPPMKAKACELGADALVIKNVSDADSGKYGASENATAVAIKYISEK